MSGTARGDLTAGAPGRRLLAFALPILVINLLQAVYNLADMVILGQVTGAPGMSAVGIGGQVTTVVLVVVTAIANGGAAIMGRYFGAGNREEIKRLLSTMLSFTLIVALVLTAAVIAACRPILRFLNTPAESFDGAVAYLIICMCGTVVVYAYNAFYAVLRAIGNSAAPMRIMLLTTVENIALDLLFIAVFRLGAAGAAIATVISQATSAALICRCVCRAGLFEFHRGALKIEGGVLSGLLRICAPQVVQMVLTNTSFLLINGLINVFDVNHSAAAAAVTKIWNLTVLAGQALMAAMISMTAQNCAKGEYRRVLSALTTGSLVAAGIGGVFTLLCELIPGPMLSLFTKEAPVIAAGISYLRYFAIGFMAENVMFCLFGTLTGSGHTIVPMCCAIITSYLVRYLFALILSQHTPLGFDGIAIAYSLAPFISTGICAAFMATGRWKRVSIAQ